MDHVSSDLDQPTQSGRGLDPAKRRAILEGAQEVFLRDGYDAASMDDVARSAGVGKMTVYRHFGSKSALFRDMLRDICTAAFFDAEATPAARFEDELTGLGHAFVDLITDPQRLGTYRLAMAEGERNPDVSRMFYEGAVIPVCERIAARMRAHAPRVPEPDALELAGLFLQIVQGHAYMRLMMGIDKAPDPAAFARQIALATEIVGERVRRAG